MRECKKERESARSILRPIFRSLFFSKGLENVLCGRGQKGRKGVEVHDKGEKGWNGSGVIVSCCSPFTSYSTIFFFEWVLRGILFVC